MTRADSPVSPGRSEEADELVDAQFAGDLGRAFAKGGDGANLGSGDDRDPIELCQARRDRIGHRRRRQPKVGLAPSAATGRTATASGLPGESSPSQSAAAAAAVSAAIPPAAQASAAGASPGPRAARTPGPAAVAPVTLVATRRRSAASASAVG